jgi:hypothetical protein
MLIVRREQVRVFEEAALADFLNRLEHHLAGVIAGCEEWEPGRLSKEIRAGLSCGRKYKIITEQGIARLTELVVTRLGGFAGDPLTKPMRNALLAYGRPEAERLDALAKLLTEAEV